MKKSVSIDEYKSPCITPKDVLVLLGCDNPSVEFDIIDTFIMSSLMIHWGLTDNKLAKRTNIMTTFQVSLELLPGDGLLKIPRLTDIFQSKQINFKH